MLEKLKRHVEKQQTAVQEMDDLLKKLAAVDIQPHKWMALRRAASGPEPGEQEGFDVLALGR